MSKLIDVSTVITKGTTPSTVGCEFVSEGINFVKSESIGQNKYLDSTLYEHITQETNDILNRSKLKEGDLLFSIAGAYLGKLAIVRKEDLPANTNQAVGIVRVNSNKVDVDYLYYYFSQKYMNEYINKLSSQSGQPNLNLELLGNLEFTDRPLDEQLRMANVLSILDKKILNNNKIILELESMTKTMFDYWFLQFEFPNEDGKPYKSSGGKMVWNDELKREIPEGWTVKMISDLMEISNIKIKPSEIGERIYAPIEVIPKNRMSFYETAPINKATTGLCKFDSKSILLSNRRVYFHKVCISPFDGVTRDTVIIMNPKNRNNLGFAFQLVNSNHFINYATLNSYGTEQPVLSPQTVMEYKLPYSNNELDIKYSSLVNSYIDKVLELERENRVLTELRDFLLPMLMNGQVTFKEEA